MAQQTLTKTYEGKSYTFHSGIDAQGKAPTRIDLSHPSEKGQQQRVILRELKFTCDEEGNLKEVHTTFEHQEFYNEGGIIPSRTFTRAFKTADAETPVFLQNFLPQLQPSVYNMYARGGDVANGIALGQNLHPAFDSVTGTFKPEEITTPGTFDYPHETTD